MKHKLDQLFKKRLQALEVAPTARATEKFNDLISDRKGGYWLYVAASVAILICFILIYRADISDVDQIAKQDNSESSSSGHADSIKNAAVPIPEVDDPVANQGLQQIEASPDPFVASEKDRTEPAMAADIHVADNSPERPFVEDSILTTTPGPTDIEDAGIIKQIATAEEKSGVIKEPLPVVTITYISGNRKRGDLLAESQAQVADSVVVKEGAFSKILNSARSLADGSLIAELRDAKENFLNRNND